MNFDDNMGPDQNALHKEKEQENGGNKKGQKLDNVCISCFQGSTISIMINYTG